MTTKPIRRIGLVDDDERVRFATSALLNLHEYEVQAFDSAEALLATECLIDFDCLIIDYRMRGLSGLDLPKELERRQSTVPAIIVSGFTSETEASELSVVGAAAIMDKPVNTRELVAQLARIIESRDDK
jgi:FixJ family two-component response regulator